MMIGDFVNSSPRLCPLRSRLDCLKETTVAYVITDNCIKDGLCLDACPNDSIHPRTDEADFNAATQMYINPEECIDCGACQPACTSDAIFAFDELPADKSQFAGINEAYFASH
jgi:NAD-dependent dihydropyrimidine dehydrogenase PreA subunit